MIMNNDNNEHSKNENICYHSFYLFSSVMGIETSCMQTNLLSVKICSNVVTCLAKVRINFMPQNSTHQL